MQHQWPCFLPPCSGSCFQSYAPARHSALSTLSLLLLPVLGTSHPQVVVDGSKDTIPENITKQRAGTFKAATGSPPPAPMSVVSASPVKPQNGFIAENKVFTEFKYMPLKDFIPYAELQGECKDSGTTQCAAAGRYCGRVSSHIVRVTQHSMRILIALRALCCCIVLLQSARTALRVKRSNSHEVGKRGAQVVAAHMTQAERVLPRECVEQSAVNCNNINFANKFST